MKTLYESILDDIDVQMSNGDEWVKEIEKEKKEFLKLIGSVNYYDTPELGVGIRRKNNKVLRCRLFAPYTIEQLGFNANAIKIIIGPVYETDDWSLKISFYTVEDKSKLGTVYVKPLWEKKAYLESTEFSKTLDIIKDLLKPATKSLDSFKKFLNNMEKWNEQLVGKQLLLK
jgi:hypothetical protein